MFPHKGGIQESHLLGWWNASSLTLINFFPPKSIKNSWQNWAFFLLRVFVDSIFLSGWVFRISNFSNISCDRQGWNFRFVSRYRYQAIRSTGAVGHSNIQTPPIVPLPPWRKTGSRPLQTGLQFQKSHPSICKLNVEGNHEQFLKHLSIGARRRYDTKSLPLIIYLAENLEIIYKATPKILKTKIKECPMKGQLLQKWSQILCSVVGSALSEIEEWQC